MKFFLHFLLSGKKYHGIIKKMNDLCWRGAVRYPRRKPGGLPASGVKLSGFRQQGDIALERVVLYRRRRRKSGFQMKLSGKRTE